MRMQLRVSECESFLETDDDDDDSGVLSVPVLCDPTVRTDNEKQKPPKFLVSRASSRTMLRLRFDEPLPPRLTRRGEQFAICLSVVNERGLCPYPLPRKGFNVGVGLVNSGFQPVTTHTVQCEPKQPVIDTGGRAKFFVTITGKDKADVCAASVPLQLIFESKVQVQFDSFGAHGGSQQQAPAGKKAGGGKVGCHASDGGPATLELNVVSPSIVCLKPGAKKPEAGSGHQPSPSDCVKTVYHVLGHKLFCCEGQQLVDDIMPGLAHTVWDAGILLSLYLEHELARKPSGMKGFRVIELGAGPGLAGSVAALAGASVTLTDLAPAIFLIGGVNITANMPTVSTSKSGGSMEAVELAWGETVIGGHPKLDPKLTGRWDYILGSDIVFNEELFAPLISSLLSLTELVPDKATKDGGRKSAGVRRTKILLTYRERERCARHGCYWREFFGELANHFDVEEVKLEGAAAAFAKNSQKVTEKAVQRLAMVQAVRKQVATEASG